MRTPEKFSKVYKEAKYFTRWHGFAWIVPTEDDYCISIVEPRQKELPRGTSAVSLEYCKASKQWCFARFQIQSDT